MTHQIRIKNMVCARCVSAVQQLLDTLNIDYTEVRLGKVQLTEPLHNDTLQQLEKGLKQQGFELLSNKNQQLIEQIKNLLLQKIASLDIEAHFSIVQYLSGELHRDYSGMSQLFSQTESITIEQYFISQKIEKTKELLSYEELTLTEIAWKLGYKNVQHLSTQFKKITGMTPGNFRKLKDPPRIFIDKLNI
ncbi:MAG: AraC family transcriptional regulator [Capnocytophaga sp.]|nr:AraC family transcriptional regulator [Capnocytophaga sp.]